LYAQVCSTNENLYLVFTAMRYAKYVKTTNAK
jgi:hypothetical protein